MLPNPCQFNVICMRSLLGYLTCKFLSIIPSYITLRVLIAAFKCFSIPCTALGDVWVQPSSGQPETRQHPQGRLPPSHIWGSCRSGGRHWEAGSCNRPSAFGITHRPAAPHPGSAALPGPCGARHRRLAHLRSGPGGLMSARALVDPACPFWASGRPQQSSGVRRARWRLGCGRFGVGGSPRLADAFYPARAALRFTEPSSSHVIALPVPWI